MCRGVTGQRRGTVTRYDQRDEQSRLLSVVPGHMRGGNLSRGETVPRVLREDRRGRSQLLSAVQVR